MALSKMDEGDLIDDCLDCLKNMGGAAKKVFEYLDYITTNIDSIASLGNDYHVKSKAREVIFKTRLVFTCVFEELLQLRSFRRVAVDAIWSINGEFEFKKMQIDTFLKDNVLSKYKSFFDEKDIALARELLDKELFDIDEVKSLMKPASFKRLKEELRKAESRKNFLANEMKKELDQAGKVCEQKSEEVTAKLNATCNDLLKVMSALNSSLTNERQRRDYDKWAWAVGGVLFGALTLCSGIALFVAISKSAVALGILSAAIGVPSAVATCVSVMGYADAKKDIKSIDELIKDLNGQQSQWENHVKLTINCWTILIDSFLHLVHNLEDDGDALKTTEKHDVKSRMEEAKAALDKFDHDIDELEEKIKRIACN